MKKIILFFFFIMAAISNAGAQSLMESQQWRDLIDDLQNENWQEANTKSLTLLNKMPNPVADDVTAALLRTMYIHSEAGLMNEGKVTQEQAINAVNGFVGKLIILPAHTVGSKGNLNTIKMMNQKTDTLYVAETNRMGTDIFAFVHVILNDKWSVEDFKSRDGQFYSLGGYIKTISVEGHILPRFRIFLERGIYQKYEQ